MSFGKYMPKLRVHQYSFTKCLSPLDVRVIPNPKLHYLHVKHNPCIFYFCKTMFIKSGYLEENHFRLKKNVI
ncbi:hypothetical protein JTE90_024489 [Oedothorax gibbosus]|uniref:Uncharacterized protein n=1 Tax=Oedothorax gibbosus TaxID=931172 RepID=A0AAV6U6E8_9ARAC|nr:hypothetical protein JTE90_024489 [Oedothorax gibbosus]